MKVVLLGNLVPKLMVGMFHSAFSVSLFFISVVGLANCIVMCSFSFFVLVHVHTISLSACLSKAINGFDNLMLSYTFCGLATMILINEVNRLDLAALIVRQCFLF